MTIEQSRVADAYLSAVEAYPGRLLVAALENDPELVALVDGAAALGREAVDAYLAGDRDRAVERAAQAATIEQVSLAPTREGATRLGPWYRLWLLLKEVSG